MLLISSLLLMAAGLWNYSTSASVISELLESYSAHSYKGVYNYDKSTNKYELNLNKIKQQFSSEFLPDAIRQLNNQLRDDKNTNKKIDFLFVSVRVDPVSGDVLGISPFSEQDIIGIGSQAIPDFLSDGKSSNGELDFNYVLNQYIQANSQNLAIPSLNYGISDNQERFLEHVPLLAARALYNFGEASVLHSLGVLEHSYVWDIRVSALRGDI